MSDKLFAAPKIRYAAGISDCGTYRYWLTRTWDDSLPTLAIIGLNPSVADAEIDDPTIRREMDFARRWRFGGISKGNLFAFRSTDPRELRSALLADPVGPENDAALLVITERRLVLCAWGARGTFMGRDRHVMRMLAGRELVCLGVTKDGHPKHPLYLAGVTPLVPFPAPASAGYTIKIKASSAAVAPTPATIAYRDTWPGAPASPAAETPKGGEG
jgi:hypothetical protein